MSKNQFEQGYKKGIAHAETFFIIELKTKLDTMELKESTKKTIMDHIKTFCLNELTKT